MKKIDYLLLILLAAMMLAVFLVKHNLVLAQLVLLTTILPMLILAVVGGRFVYYSQGKVSLFYILAMAGISSLVVLFYTLAFPWQELMSGQSSVLKFSPNLGNVISTFVTEFVLTSVVALIVKVADRTGKEG